jgi:exopolyphosphatase/guanosine-5'-triphosphate,3'-diphosphate pyrophosphatase
MKLAAIDIGTNSTRLLITDYRHNKFFPLERKMEVTRLGRDLDKNKTILDDSARETLKALSGYWRLVKDYNVKKYRAVGTSAIREASNGDWFVSYIYKCLGMRIEVIGGPEEARLSFYGAVRDIDLIQPTCKTGVGARVLVVDIGGGSSEFILGDCNCNLELVKSVNLGCVSLTEKFIGSGIPDMNSLDRMKHHITNRLEEIIKKIKQHKSEFIIGVGGTITTLAAIDLKLKVYNSERIHRHILSFKRIEDIYKDLCRLDLKERKKVVGLHSKRADIIIGGTAIAIEILKMLDIKEILVSERDILDGIIYTLVDF